MGKKKADAEPNAGTAEYYMLVPRGELMRPPAKYRGSEEGEDDPADDDEPGTSD